MGRRLPWKTVKAEETEAPLELSLPVASTLNGPAARISGSSSSRIHSPALDVRHRQVLESDPARSPSTSPPPEPPAEVFMIAGSQHDDRFRMVEDEFLLTAQKFTAHLHRAEYERLKTLARSRHAGTISEIERPVVQGLEATWAAKRRSAEALKRKKQRKMTAPHGSSGGVDSTDAKLKDISAFAGAKGLLGLLEKPREDLGTIQSYAPGPSATRAAAGLPSQTGRQDRGGSRQRSMPLVTGTTADMSSERPRRRIDETDEESTSDNEDIEPAADLFRQRNIRQQSSRPSEMSHRRSPATPQSSGRRNPGSSSAVSMHRLPQSRSSPYTPSVAKESSRAVDRSSARKIREDGSCVGKDGDDDNADDDDDFGLRRRTQLRQQRRQPRSDQQKDKAKEVYETIPTFL